MQIHLSGKAAEIVQAQMAYGIYADAGEFVSDVLLKYQAYYRKSSRHSIEKSPLAWSKRIEENAWN